MKAKKLGIVIYGTCKSRVGFWEEWMDTSKELIHMMGYIPTHASITGTSLSENLRTFQRSERKMREVMANGEPVKSLSVFSLPNSFRCCFDSNCFFAMADGTGNRYAKYAYCEMNFEESSKKLVERIKNALFDFIAMEQCEIFTMNETETMYNYVFKGMGDDVDKYPSLKVLSWTGNN